MKSLNVLFWLSPITELSWPRHKAPWLKTWIPRIVGALEGIGYSVRPCVLLSSDLVRGAACDGVGFETIELEQDELLGGFRFNALDETIRFLEDDCMTEFFRHLGEVVKRHLPDSYRPDVVFAFSAAPFFKEIYPEAVLLYHEYGMFSREPYPETWYFDPTRPLSRNFASVHAGEIINRHEPAEDGVLDALRAFREDVRSALMANASVSGYFQSLRGDYGQLLLLPLAYEGFADSRVGFPYQSQFEFVEHVLSTVDRNVAVILTQHPCIKALKPEIIEDLKTRHANLQSEEWYSAIPNFSQLAIAYCDACVTQCSSLAYQAAFLGKRLVTLGGFCQGLADGAGVESLAVDGQITLSDRDRDDYFIWLVRHYITDAAGMPQHLGALIERLKGTRAAADSPFSYFGEGLSDGQIIELLRKWRRQTAAFAEKNRLAEYGIMAPGEAPLRSDEFKVAILQGEREALMAERRELFAQRDGLARERDALLQTRDALLQTRDALLKERVELTADRDRLADLYRGVTESTCWRMTQPIRRMLDAVKAFRRRGNPGC